MEAAKPKPRWFQFGLRSLLVLTTIAGLFLGYHVIRVQKQQKAIASIEAIGGAISYDAFDPAWDWLRSIIGDKYFRKVVAVNLGRKKATDLHAESLACFPEITQLVLSHTQISDQGMKHLQGLTELTWLEVEYLNIGDDGIVYCKDLQKLMTLRFTGTNVSAAGVARISKLSRTLGELWLDRTKVTDQEAKNIKSQWPNTTIVYGNGKTI